MEKDKLMAEPESNRDWELITALEIAIDELRPHGKWIYNGFTYRCSECGKPPKTLGACGSTIFVNESFKYCPECGAKMDGQEADNEQAK